jgi:hypothetical protein
MVGIQQPKHSRVGARGNKIAGNYKAPSYVYKLNVFNAPSEVIARFI